MLAVRILNYTFASVTLRFDDYVYLLEILSITQIMLP